MTVSTFYSTSTDGYIAAQGTTFLRSQDALDGYAYAAAGAASGQLGNAKFGATDFFVMQDFIGFDTSAIPDTDSISAAVLSLYGNTSHAVANFVIEAAALDWSGGGITVADFRNKAAANALTPLANWDTANGWSISGYNDFTTLSGMAATINKTGSTYFVLFSRNDRLDVACTTEEWVVPWLGADSTRKPKLTVTHSGVAISGTSMIGGGFFP
jgi:hypothetical protein